MKLSQVATIVPLVIIAIGLIGWVLTLLNDVTGTVGQLDGIHEEISAIHELIGTDIDRVHSTIDELRQVQDQTIDGLYERLIGLEEQLALADNEMRTIMADHSGFNEVLQELGKAGLLPSGERREYGGYGYK